MHVFDESVAKQNGLESAVYYGYISSQVSEQLSQLADVRISTTTQASDENAPYIVWISLNRYPDM